jgi:hypothetical protein
MVSLVAQRDSRAWQRRTAGQQYRKLQCAGRCGGGVPKPERLQDGDGTGDRTGWPAVIRGCREQYRSGNTRKCSSQYPAVKSVSSTWVKASAADARTWRFGSGVPSQSRRRTGDGAGCRSVALQQATEQFVSPALRSPPLGKQLVTEGRTEELSAIRIARAEVLSPGTAGHR